MQSYPGKHSKNGSGNKTDDRPSLSNHQRDYKHRRNTSSLFSDSSGDSSGSEGAAADEYVFFEMRHPGKTSVDKVLGGLEDLRSEGHFCDVSLSVDGQLYPAHKCVLSAFSPYFKAMFTGRMAESQQQVVTLQGLDGPTLAILLDYAYSAVAHINSSNAQALLSAANLFGIHSLRSACCRYLTQHMDSTNALGILCFAETHACARMAANARAFVHKNFREVSDQEEFLTLSPSKLREILSSDHLVAESEEVVFNAAVRWLDHDPQERAKGFHKILEVVRLHLLSPYYLHDFLELVRLNGITPKEEEEHIEEEKAGKKEDPEPPEKVIVEVTNSNQTSPKQKEGMEIPKKEEKPVELAAAPAQNTSNCQSTNPTPTASTVPPIRKSASTGSRKNDGSYCSSCKGHKHRSSCLQSASSPTVQPPAFNKECIQLLKDACLYHLLPDRRSEMPHPERSRLRACSDTCQVVFAVGGEDDKVVLRAVECFTPSSGEWRALECLPFAISKHGLVASCSSNWAYLCGGEFPDGRPSAQAWRYDPFLANAWTEVSSMSTTRSELGLAMLDGSIFAVGGWDGGFGLDSVERYDPWRNQWFAVPPMPHPLASPAVVSHHGLLYVIGGQYLGIHIPSIGGTIQQEGDGIDLVQRYDPRCNAWHNQGNMLIPRSGAVACAIGHYIYVMGGWHASTENTNKVERYDVRNNCWEYRAPMQEKRYRPGATVVEGEIYVLGGEGGWNMYLETIEKYSPTRDVWVPAGEMPTGRSWLSCIALQIILIPNYDGRSGQEEKIKEIKSSIFTAEVYAIKRALETIKSHNTSYMICSDSKSALQSISSFDSRHPLVQDAQSSLTHLEAMGNRIIFVWIPGHVGIEGNEMADSAAKDALKKGETDSLTLTAQDLGNSFRRVVLKEWQDSWAQIQNNKLRDIKVSPVPWTSSLRDSRREEVVTTRLRIGHCALTHSYLFTKEKNPPYCDHCASRLTIRHLLTECTQHVQLRIRFGIQGELKEILGDDSNKIDAILMFLREAKLLPLI